MSEQTNTVSTANTANTASTVDTNPTAETPSAPQSYLDQVQALRKEFDEKYQAKQVQDQKQPETAPELPTEGKEKDTSPVDIGEPQDYDSPLDFTIQLLSTQTNLTEDNFVDSIRNALRYSDESLIDYDKLVSGLKPDQVNHVKYIAKQMYQEAQTKTASIQKDAYEIAGGEAAWKQAVSAFNSTSVSKAVQVQAQALEQGGYIKEAVNLVINTVRDLGLVTHKQQPVMQGSGKASPAPVLSPSQYRNEIGTLIKTYGTNFLSNREANTKYQELTKQLNQN